MKNRLTLLEGIARGEKAVLDGRVLTHEEAKKKMARWHKDILNERAQALQQRGDQALDWDEAKSR
jgi:predicted transcriptional regulator